MNDLKDYISNAFTEIDGDWNLCCAVCHRVIFTDMKIVARLKVNILST